MIAAGAGGAIVNVASIMGLSGGGLYPNVSYRATKGAIVNMTRALAVEMKPHAIRVNAVAPTYVRTELIGPILKDPALIARIEAMTPLRRLAEPADIAAAIAFLAGPAATMITGHTLAVDGGIPGAVERTVNLVKLQDQVVARLANSLGNELVTAETAKAARSQGKRGRLHSARRGLPRRFSHRMQGDLVSGSGANGRIWAAMMSAELPEGWAWAS